MTRPLTGTFATLSCPSSYFILNAPGLDSGHFVSSCGRAGCVSVLLLILILEVRTISTEVRYLSLSRCCVTSSHHRIGVLGLISVLLLILFLIVEKLAWTICTQVRSVLGCDNFSSCYPGAEEGVLVRRVPVLLLLSR